MVDYNGWLVIKESIDGDGEDNIDVLINKLSSQIESLKSGNNLFVLKPINGNYFFHCAGFTNHFTEEIKELMLFFQFVAKIAVGSYGLLYLRNDEDKLFYNEFQVYKVSKGNCILVKDVYLSPCDPEIEK